MTELNIEQQANALLERCAVGLETMRTHPWLDVHAHRDANAYVFELLRVVRVRVQLLRNVFEERTRLAIAICFLPKFGALLYKTLLNCHCERDAVMMQLFVDVQTLQNGLQDMRSLWVDTEECCTAYTNALTKAMANTINTLRVALIPLNSDNLDSFIDAYLVVFEEKDRKKFENVVNFKPLPKTTRWTLMGVFDGLVTFRR